MQRRLTDALQGEPIRRFTIEQLAEIDFRASRSPEAYGERAPGLKKNSPASIFTRCGQLSRAPTAGVTSWACGISVLSAAIDCTHLRGTDRLGGGFATLLTATAP